MLPTLTLLVVFGDVPNRLAIAGMAVVMLAGLLIVLLEGRTRTGPALP
jgi:hypothetical protein